MNDFIKEKLKEFREKFDYPLWKENGDDIAMIKGENAFSVNAEVEYFIEQALHQARLNALEEVERLITEEILICHKENTPTSRLTSLIMKIKTLTA